jgi:hypothetical protein
LSQQELRAALQAVTERVLAYRAGADARPQRPLQNYDAMRAAFSCATPEKGAPIVELIAELADIAEPGLANMVGPRFFGWVIGATAPAGMAADWLTSGLGAERRQCRMPRPQRFRPARRSPRRWLLDLLDLPRAGVRRVRHRRDDGELHLSCCGAGRGVAPCGMGCGSWTGLFGAPPVHVVLGEEAHSTVFSGPAVSRDWAPSAW